MVVVNIGLVALVFVSAVVIDFASARYIRAVGDGRAHRAAQWSGIQWLAAVTGYIVAMKYSLWVLPAELAGLYVGTLLSVRRSKARTQTSS